MDASKKKRTLHKFLIENFYIDKTPKTKTKKDSLKFKEQYKEGFVIINLPSKNSSYNNLLLTLIMLYNDLR